MQDLQGPNTKKGPPFYGVWRAADAVGANGHGVVGDVRTVFNRMRGGIGLVGCKKGGRSVSLSSTVISGSERKTMLTIQLWSITGGRVVVNVATPLRAITGQTGQTSTLVSTERAYDNHAIEK